MPGVLGNLGANPLDVAPDFLARPREALLAPLELLIERGANLRGIV